MPVSLSPPYETNETGTRACVPPTPMYGMPYGGGPKSGCSARVAPMNAMNAAEFASTGAWLMSWFHQLSAGNNWRPPRSSLTTTDEDADEPSEGEVGPPLGPFDPHAAT